MPEAIQFDASDAIPLPRGSEGGPGEQLFGTADERRLCINRRRWEGSGSLSPVQDSRRVLLVLEGRGARVDHGVDGPPTFLRPLDPYGASAAWRTEIQGEVTMLEVLQDAEQAPVKVNALHLGQRVLRESLTCGAAFLLAHGGSLLARITDEEEPFHLAAGESLWLDDLESDMELEVRGLESNLCLIHLQVGGLSE